MTKARVHLGPDGLPAPKFPRVKGRLPLALERCPGCGHHLFASAKKCVHCGGNLLELKKQQLVAYRAAQRAAKTLKKLFG